MDNKKTLDERKNFAWLRGMMVVVEVDERRVERRHRRSGERSEKEKKRERKSAR